ncbi:hypothetical protein C1A50_2182 [Paenibacillus polymyxa]|nr:hypothetical protein C1A50_2182 [Paenibacillus polymyxa]
MINQIASKLMKIRAYLLFSFFYEEYLSGCRLVQQTLF